MTGAEVKVLRRVDAPGVIIYARARDRSGREAAIYLEPADAMALVDQVAQLAEKWTLPAAVIA